MGRVVFAVLGFLVLRDAGMAQNNLGPSGWAQAKHLEYERHFSQGPTYLSNQMKTMGLINATPSKEDEWPEYAGDRVTAGSVEFYIDHNIPFDQALSKKAPFFLLFMDRELPSFGWNLESFVGRNKSSDFQNPSPPEDVTGKITPPQVSGYIFEFGDALITRPTKEWQMAVDENMRNAVREMSKDTRNTMFEDSECRSGKSFMAPADPRWIWYTETQETYAERGTITMITGPFGIKLIRITGTEPTQINGTGDMGEQEIFLVNPNGVVVGPGGKPGPLSIKTNGISSGGFRKQ